MLYMQRHDSFMRMRYGCVLLIAALAGCGDDSDDGDKTAPKGGTGGTETRSDSTRGGGSGGAGAGRGGSGGNGGDRGGNLPRADQDPNASAYRCVPRPADKGASAAADAACCGGLGVCSKDISENIAAGLPRDVCSTSSNLRCVPLEPMAASGTDAGASTGGFATCRVQLPGAPANYPDYEGRCVPSCFAQASPVAGRLAMSTCQQGETCAPCFSPLTGESTGTCELFDDAPVEPAPAALAECGDGLGYCVPAFAAGMSAAQLTQLTCGPGELCGPKSKVADPGACFEHCDAGLYGPGACVPMFITSGFSTFLTASTCTNNQVCAPCELFGSRLGVCD